MRFYATIIVIIGLVLAGNAQQIDVKTFSVLQRSAKDQSIINPVLSVWCQLYDFPQLLANEKSPTITYIIYDESGKIKDFEKLGLDTSEAINESLIQETFKLSPGLYDLEVIIEWNEHTSITKRISANLTYSPIADIMQVDNVNQTTNSKYRRAGNLLVTPSLHSIADVNDSVIRFFIESAIPTSSTYSMNLSSSKGSVYTKEIKLISGLQFKFISIPVNNLKHDYYQLSFITKNSTQFQIPTTKFLLTDNGKLPGNFHFEHELDSHQLEKAFAEQVPIAGVIESRWIGDWLKAKPLDTLRKHMRDFWIARDSSEPFYAWMRYKIKLQLADSLYGTGFKQGFETDRGTIFLKYGMPYEIVNIDNEPEAYPYQIWQYYHVNNQGNGRFIFYNSTLVPNDYELLHSTVRGELQNRRWEAILHSRNTVNNNFEDNGNTGRNYGRRSSDFFNAPR